MLEVNDIDWHLLENAKAHHTDKFEVLHEESTPVLRRAQPFKMSITFNRPFNESTDRIRLYFLYGSKKITPRIQSIIENTTVTSHTKINSSYNEWSLELISEECRTITILVRSPPIAAWGLWNLTITTSFKTTAKTLTWKSPYKFYLLFNPWVPEDDVFMPDTRYLDEYILNDIGKVYTSSAKKPIGMKWIFGQFAAPVVNVVMKLIDNSDLDEIMLGSPVELCFFLTKNLGDILHGSWSGDYSDGTAPWLWTGSIPIYEEYLRTGISVKYGQCFTYSALYTTALRAIGIPARSVTNFISAMDGYSMSVNYVFNKNGEIISSSSIWNFHSWNDAWMARYDLPSGYGGWQATDVGNFDGPASVQAIKKGEISYRHSTRGFLGCINADRVRWTKDENDDYHLISVDTKHIGRCLLTKQPFIFDPHGDTDFQDVISDYKELEGSTEERMALYNAIKLCKVLDRKDDVNYLGNIPTHVEMPLQETVKMQFNIEEIDHVILGDPFCAALNIKNTGDEEATVECCVAVSSMYYNGSSAGIIKNNVQSVVVEPTSEKLISLEISPTEYAAKLVEFSNIKIHCLARIMENNFTWADDYNLVVETQEIIVETKTDLEVNKEGYIFFHVKNPLKTKLTDCSLTYEAPGIGRNIHISTRDVEADKEVIIEHTVVPTNVGEIPIKVIFRAKELNFLGGTSTLHVTSC